MSVGVGVGIGIGIGIAPAFPQPLAENLALEPLIHHR